MWRWSRLSGGGCTLPVRHHCRTLPPHLPTAASAAYSEERTYTDFLSAIGDRRRRVRRRSRQNVFHVVGLDADGGIVQRVKFRRDTSLAFFEQASTAIFDIGGLLGVAVAGLEAGGDGHRVRIIPAQFVKPYVKSQKNDTIDAEAIAEAATRPTMRFTRVRTTEEVDLLALHRIRDQLISSRTRLINQVRGFCLEYGVAIHQGAGVFRRDLPRALADEENDLTPAMRRMLAKLYEDI